MMALRTVQFPLALAVVALNRLSSPSNMPLLTPDLKVVDYAVRVLLHRLGEIGNRLQAAPNRPFVPLHQKTGRPGRVLAEDFLQSQLDAPSTRRPQVVLRGRKTFCSRCSFV